MVNAVADFFFEKIETLVEIVGCENREILHLRNHFLETILNQFLIQ